MKDASKKITNDLLKTVHYTEGPSRLVDLHQFFGELV